MGYHMRRSDRQITDDEEIWGLINKGKYATIAMCKGDEPYVVTLNYGADRDKRALYFHCAVEGQKLDFLRANPRVCATIIHDKGYYVGECSHGYETVIIRGTISEITDIPGKRAALEHMVNQLDPDPGRVITEQLGTNVAWDKVAILRLDINEMTAKHGK